MPEPEEESLQIPDELQVDNSVEARLARRQLLISAWNARNKLYRNLFGDYAQAWPSTYCAPPALSEAEIEAQSQQDDWQDTGDPGEPDAGSKQLAILSYPPDPLRPYWIYITAGLSSPWLQNKKQEVSGFGCELMFKSPIDAQWPLAVLRSIAFYIFNHAGTLSPGARIGLNAPIVEGSDSALRNLFIWYADEAPDCWYELPSGGFGIFTAIGITNDELKYAESIEEYGTWCIQQVLRETGHAQVTDPKRESVMKRKDIESVLNSVSNYAKQFKEALEGKDEG